MRYDGWAKLHRRFLEQDWYYDTNTKLVFIHLLLTVNSMPRSYGVKSIEAGQRVFTRKALAKEVGISIQQLRTALDKLMADNKIIIESTNKGSLVTINNWAFYEEE